MKLCKDCKHKKRYVKKFIGIVIYTNEALDKCGSAHAINASTGEADSFCEIERGYDRDGLCGKAGKYWEAIA